GDVLVGQALKASSGVVDPSAHAEVLALREAARKIGNYRLSDATLFSTLEPCTMCCGAVIQARLARVVYGAPDPRAGAIESLYRLLDGPRLSHRGGGLGGRPAGRGGAVRPELF